MDLDDYDTDDENALYQSIIAIAINSIDNENLISTGVDNDDVQKLIDNEHLMTSK